MYKNEYRDEQEPSQEEAPVEIDEETGLPQDMEVLQSTDGVGGDMKFVMVNQQEVFVVKNSSPQQQK